MIESNQTSSQIQNARITAGEIEWKVAIEWIKRYRKQMSEGEPIFYVIPFGSLYQLISEIVKHNSGGGIGDLGLAEVNIKDNNKDRSSKTLKISLDGKTLKNNQQLIDDPFLFQIASLQEQGLINDVRIKAQGDGYTLVLSTLNDGNRNNEVKITHIKIYFGLKTGDGGNLEKKLIFLPANHVIEEGNEFYSNVVIAGLNPVDYGSLCPPSCGAGGIQSEQVVWQDTLEKVQDLQTSQS